jgi:hypothetical protein
MDERPITSVNSEPEVEEAWAVEVERRQADTRMEVSLLPDPETLAKLKAEFQ